MAARLTNSNGAFSYHITTHPDVRSVIINITDKITANLTDDGTIAAPNHGMYSTTARVSGSSNEVVDINPSASSTASIFKLIDGVEYIAVGTGYTLDGTYVESYAGSVCTYYVRPSASDFSTVVSHNGGSIRVVATRTNDLVSITDYLVTIQGYQMEEYFTWQKKYEADSDGNMDTAYITANDDDSTDALTSYTGGLTNGQPYEVSIAAINIAGYAIESSSYQVIPQFKPNKVNELVVLTGVSILVDDFERLTTSENALVISGTRGDRNGVDDTYVKVALTYVNNDGEVKQGFKQFDVDQFDTGFAVVTGDVWTDSSGTDVPIVLTNGTMVYVKVLVGNEHGPGQYNDDAVEAIPSGLPIITDGVIAVTVGEAVGSGKLSVALDTAYINSNGSEILSVGILLNGEETSSDLNIDAFSRPVKYDILVDGINVIVGVYVRNANGSSNEIEHSEVTTRSSPGIVSFTGEAPLANAVSDLGDGAVSTTVTMGDVNGAPCKIVIKLFKANDMETVVQTFASEYNVDSSTVVFSGLDNGDEYKIGSFSRNTFDEESSMVISEIVVPSMPSSIAPSFDLLNSLSNIHLSDSANKVLVNISPSDIVSGGYNSGGIRLVATSRGEMPSIFTLIISPDQLGTNVPFTNLIVGGFDENEYEFDFELFVFDEVYTDTSTTLINQISDKSVIVSNVVISVDATVDRVVDSPNSLKINWTIGPSAKYKSVADTATIRLYVHRAIQSGIDDTVAYETERTLVDTIVSDTGESGEHTFIDLTYGYKYHVEVILNSRDHAGTSISAFSTATSTVFVASIKPILSTDSDGVIFISSSGSPMEDILLMFPDETGVMNGTLMSPTYYGATESVILNNPVDTQISTYLDKDGNAQSMYGHLANPNVNFYLLFAENNNGTSIMQTGSPFAVS